MLAETGHLRAGARVLDFGSQNIYGDFEPDLVRRFLAAFGRDERYAVDLTARGAKIDALMDAAGFDYTAIDMYSSGRAQRLDLNTDSLPDDMRGQFDLVANWGTTEHVCNQYNAFKVAHDALKVGGIMFNQVPFYGCVNHGLFNYHPKFFTTLVANNAYEPLRFALTPVFDGNETHYRDIAGAETGWLWEGKYTGMALMYCVFRKILDAPFLPPTDNVLSGDVQVGYPTVNQMLGYSAPPRPFISRLLRRVARLLTLHG